MLSTSSSPTWRLKAICWSSSIACWGKTTTTLSSHTLRTRAMVSGSSGRRRSRPLISAPTLGVSFRTREFHPLLLPRNEYQTRTQREIPLVALRGFLGATHASPPERGRTGAGHRRAVQATFVPGNVERRGPQCSAARLSHHTRSPVRQSCRYNEIGLRGVRDETVDQLPPLLPFHPVDGFAVRAHEQRRASGLRVPSHHRMPHRRQPVGFLPRKDRCPYIAPPTNGSCAPPPNRRF